MGTIWSGSRLSAVAVADLKPGDRILAEHVVDSVAGGLVRVRFNDSLKCGGCRCDGFVVEPHELKGRLEDPPGA